MLRETTLAAPTSLHRGRRRSSRPAQFFEPLEARCLLSGSPLSSLPTLHSLSGAFAKLFLDFDGDSARTWQGYNVPATPAFDQDGDASTYSTGELSSIQEIWARVAEKYSPFKVDVTTVDPGNRNHSETAQIVIGGNGSWYPGAGGVSMTDGFRAVLLSNTGFVFPLRVGNSVKNVAEASAHEAGHLFGLEHQSVWSGSTLVQEYNSGTAAKAPVMGSSYSSTRGVWWYGTSNGSPSSMQDDMALISRAANGFGYRSDDHGNASGSATSLSGSSPAASGIISQTSDSDYFSFGTTGGQVSFAADIATYGGMLDVKLSLYNSSGGLVIESDSSSLGESLSATVGAGTYYIVVASHGSYGDVGQYSLSGNVPTGAAAPVADAGGPYTVAEGGSVQLSGSSSTGTSLSYAWDLDGDGNYGETGGAATRGNETGATPTFSAAGLDGPATYNVSLRVTDASSQTSTASATISLTNVAPTLGISGANSVAEGSVYTLSLSSTDPGNDAITSWFITWGDGTTQTINGDPSSVTKTYVDNGAYTITATATDEDGTFSAGSKQITVSNVAPTITAGGNATANEGSAYTLSLSAADPGDDEITGFTIDWGDGVSEDVSVHSNGHYSHTFADNGSYTIHVSADDEDGTYTNAAQKSVTVANVAPTVSISGNSSALTAAEYSLSLDSSDPGDDTISSWLINWGDGNSQTVNGNPSAVAHTYASGGSYTISASATDDDGTYNATDKQLTISDSDTTPPQAQLTQADSLYTAGTGSYQFRITYSDASGIDADSINSSDILVSGPGGFSQIASLTGITDGENGAKIATYSISPPGGAWDSGDSGQYQISLRAAQVSDTAGNAAPAATLGTFMAGILPPDTAGLNMATARNVGTVSSIKPKIVEDGVGIPDRNDYVKFTVAAKSSITIKLYNLVDNADLYIYNASGTRVAYSKKAITSIENIVKTLSAGTYYARVMFAGVVGTPYRLRISSAAVSGTPLTPAGLAGAINLGSLARGVTKALSADITGGSIAYQFTSTGAAHLYTKLYQNTDNLQLELLDSTGQRIGFSDGAGTANEVIRATIHAATYFVRITFAGASATPFRLRLALG
jgi:hypothetical protein